MDGVWLGGLCMSSWANEWVNDTNEKSDTLNSLSHAIGHNQAGWLADRQTDNSNQTNKPDANQGKPTPLTKSNRTQEWFQPKTTTAAVGMAHSLSHSMSPDSQLVRRRQSKKDTLPMFVMPSRCFPLCHKRWTTTTTLQTCWCLKRQQKH